MANTRIFLANVSGRATGDLEWNPASWSVAWLDNPSQMKLFYRRERWCMVRGALWLTCLLNSITKSTSPIHNCCIADKWCSASLEMFCLPLVWCQLSKFCIQHAFSETVLASQPCYIIYFVSSRISLCICGCWRKRPFTLVAENIWAFSSCDNWQKKKVQRFTSVNLKSKDMTCNRLIWYSELHSTLSPTWSSN